MKIQFSTDKNINGDERHRDYFTDLIAKELEQYQSHITRIEVHLTDQNGNKDGLNDIRCLIEARIEGRQPIAVSEQADTAELAVSGAIDRLIISLDTILGRTQNH